MQKNMETIKLKQFSRIVIGPAEPPVSASRLEVADKW
jgi:hypothetical protein